jgi:hypothetical protein
MAAAAAAMESKRIDKIGRRRHYYHIFLCNQHLRLFSSVPLIPITIELSNFQKERASERAR